jgi:hypothetical protein
VDDSAIALDEIREALGHLSLDWDVEEDADVLLDLLLKAYSPTTAWIWLTFFNSELDGIPLAMLERGQSRAVFKEARRLLAQVELS